MPRQTTGRETANEANVAQRVSIEREQHGWSYDALAKRMADAGCVIQPSALFKIEKAGRRITVEELVALASVFEVSIDDLLMPVELLRNRAMKAAYSDYAATFEELGSALAAFCVATSTVASLSISEAEFSDFFENMSDTNETRRAAARRVGLRLRQDGLTIDDESAHELAKAISACMSASFSVAVAQLRQGVDK